MNELSSPKTIAPDRFLSAPRMRQGLQTNCHLHIVCLLACIPSTCHRRVVSSFFMDACTSPTKTKVGAMRHRWDLEGYSFFPRALVCNVHRYQAATTATRTTPPSPHGQSTFFLRQLLLVSKAVLTVCI